ncbi:MAG: sn-glycerol-3-phosphate ABC transporter substrate-binding protein UgpB [Bradyrhizobiaceae bacterium]|nr:sn-glycerol-3-phosphate ABC transporter substrate-binding protein UgpB [Bradyrhizobiaceae bacterium]
MSLRRALIAAGFALIFSMSQAWAATTDIQLWHAMPGELGRQLGRIVDKFNASQKQYRVIPVFKGTYAETVNAAIFAMRTRTHPAIVQVSEVGTATMMAAKGAVYPISELVQDAGEILDAQPFLPAVAGYYADISGNLLSYPFNVSTPILYYNKTLFRRAGFDPDVPPRTWPELEKTAQRLREAGVPCGFSSHWPSWIHVENFSALHDLPIATQANGLRGLDAELTINNPALVNYIAALVSWQKSRTFDYGGRGTTAEPKFYSSECAMFIGSSALIAEMRMKAKFDVGYGMLPYWPDIRAAPQNSMIGGASLWVLRGRPSAEYRGAARFFAYLAQPDVQSDWHRSTGYLPITQSAYELTRAQGFYKDNPGAELAIKQVTLNPPTDNSKAIRLGSFILIRDVIEDELELAFSGKKSPKAALDDAVKRGNELLRQFERANK